MRQIQIDDDIYEFLRQQTVIIGEGPSSILRRLLTLPNDPRAPIGPSSGPTKEPEELFDISSCRTAVQRFLAVLAHLHSRHQDEFHKVLKLRGDRRNYFAKSPNGIAQSGASTKAKQIQGTACWVVTNNDTPKKQRIVRDGMSVLGYPQDESSRVAEWINPQNARPPPPFPELPPDGENKRF